MASKPPSDSARARFAASLGGFLAQGMRPATAKGQPWTNAEFAKEVPSTRIGKVRSASSVANWRNGELLPEEIPPILRALFGPSDRHAEARDALSNMYAEAFEEARVEKSRAQGVPSHASWDHQGAEERGASGGANAPKTARKPRNLPYPSLGSLFKGREKILDDLHAALNANAGAAIAGRALHGLGGIGKTRLSVEYALKYEDQYTALLFLAAETPSRLDASLAALAGSAVLDLPEKGEREDEVKIAAALGWLEAHAGWLMILDNVDNVAAVAAVGGLLAKLKGGKVVINGRAGNFPAAVRKIELGLLDEHASVEFLLERTNDDRAHSPDDPESARQLAGELDGLALGLEQAGAYIAVEHIGFERYLKLWREKRATVLSWFDKTLMSYDHDTGLAATWATSVDRLTPDARQLLEHLAFLAPEPIPDSLLDVVAPEDPPDFDAHNARANLFAYSLVSRAAVAMGKPSPEGFSVHRLVQDFARRGMTEARRGEALWEVLRWMDEAFEGDPGDVRTWSRLDPLVTHALAVAEHGDRVGIAEPTTMLYRKLNVLLQAKARYVESEWVSRRALAIASSFYGANHSVVASCLNNLAQLLQVTNRTNEAEPLMRRAIAIDEANYGRDAPEVAVGLNNLAQLLQDTNQYGAAEPLMRRALEIDEACYGPDHPNVAIRLTNLAGLFHDKARLSDAEPLMRRALEIDERSFGRDHPRVATQCGNLGSLLGDMNRFYEAECLTRRALTIDEASFGPNHPNVAVRLNNLASLLHRTDRLGDVEPLMRRALDIDEVSFGPDHPLVAIRLNNLAQLLQTTNRLGEAEQAMRRALGIFEASYGPDHPSTVTARNNLAALEANKS